MDELKDECCICYEKNLAMSNGCVSNAVRATCCGALFCKSCNEGMDKKAAETPTRHPTCPMCRTPYPNSYEEIFERSMKHAKEGKAWAMDQVGDCYKDGKGIVQSYTKAFEYSLQAAELGQANAQNGVGFMYENGQGVEKSLEKAIHYYTLAANQGLPAAQYNLGSCFYKVQGLKKSLDKAFEWHLKAAENGSIEAQCNVGFCYSQGKGVEKNSEKAFHYYALAAKEENKNAQLCLALCYDEGYGVEKNHVVAIYWYRRCMKDNPDEELFNRAKGCIQLLREAASKHCGSCKKRDIKLTQCSKCYSIYYCSRECQGKDWKEGHHKEDCKKA